METGTNISLCFHISDISNLIKLIVFVLISGFLDTLNILK